MSNSEKPKSSWRERRQSIAHKWMAPFIFPEWLCEWVSYFLGRWAFLNILGHAGRLTILVAIVFYFAESGSRRKARHYQAWQVINAAQGKPGSGGRIDALQDLHREGISLSGVDISKAYLPELNLENADLRSANLTQANLDNANLAQADLGNANLAQVTLHFANLSGAYLNDANLAGANLHDANLAEAILNGANLTDAWFVKASLAGAVLSFANLAEAYLLEANLTQAKLENANLAEASLIRANLTEACLLEANLTQAHCFGANFAEAVISDANLAGTDLRNANLTNIEKWQEVRHIEYANIYNVKNPPDGFIEWAKKHGAVIIEDYNEWKKLLQEKR